jgi:N-methylhydantoinase A/oxoprolinase/acetone carboxylase beta subunit
MRQAVRAVTVERGIDARDLVLVAFGGAGPVHACAVADGLGMRGVVVPPRAGVFSAVGLLCAPRRRELVRSWQGGAMAPALDALAGEAAALVGAGASVETAVDCRYRGQSHELTVPSVDAFAAEHERRNGYARPDAEVELVAIRARATVDAPIRPDDLPSPERARLVGPVVAAEPDCTVWVPDGWTAVPGPHDAWIIRRRAR